MPAMGSCHVMGRTGLAPTVAEFAGTAGEAGTHIGITEGEDRAIFIDAFGHDKLEGAVPILRDSKIGHRAKMRIELRQISTACLAMENGDNFHSRFLRGDIRITRAGMSDDANVLIKVDGIHFFHNRKGTLLNGV